MATVPLLPLSLARCRFFLFPFALQVKRHAILAAKALKDAEKGSVASWRGCETELENLATEASFAWDRRQLRVKKKHRSLSRLAVRSDLTFQSLRPENLL